jgi:hypothetical protein
VLFRVRNQKAIAILRTSNPLRRLPTPAPGGAGFRITILRCDRRARRRRSRAPASEKLFRRDVVFRDLFANRRDDAVQLSNPRFFGLLFQCLLLAPSVRDR